MPTIGVCRHGRIVRESDNQSCHECQREEFVMKAKVKQLKEQKCDTCKFIRLEYPGDIYGFCHRHSPGNYSHPSFLEPTRWPRVDLTEWCGDYERESDAD